MLQFKLPAAHSVRIRAGEAKGHVPLRPPRACCHIRSRKWWRSLGQPACELFLEGWRRWTRGSDESVQRILGGEGVRGDLRYPRGRNHWSGYCKGLLLGPWKGPICTLVQVLYWALKRAINEFMWEASCECPHNVYGKYVYVVHNKQVLVVIGGIFLALCHHHHNGMKQNKTLRASVFIIIVCMLPPNMLT